MKTRNLFVLGLALACAGLTGCDELTNAIGAEQQGVIMIRLIHKSSYPSGQHAASCTETVGSYSDNNPAMPHNASSGLYGPSQAGSYSATWRWGNNNLSFTYHLSSPEPGYRRTYTIPLMIYSDTLNRCLVGTSGQMDHTDERM